MKVLWLCNIMLPVIAEHLGQEVSRKEGWISGMADALLADQSENRIALSVAFPMQSGRQAVLQQPDSQGDIVAETDSVRKNKSGQDAMNGQEQVRGKVHSQVRGPGDSAVCHGTVIAGNTFLDYYGFPEDMIHPEKYDESLEPILKNIVDIVKPDIVHCFGTEYPHTLAMCRIFPDKSRLLVGLQGLCSLLAEAYYANLPQEVIQSVTFRDWLKKDSIRQQQSKFVIRGKTEQAVVRLAGNITGRTRWDRANAKAWNPGTCYYAMNESLRREFYGPVWEEDKCIPYSIFISQGDYPLKGLHYMLLALPRILARYPDARVYVAGNSLVEYRTIKQKLKISAYGRYLRRLIRELNIKDNVVFLGMLNAEEMRDRCLKSSVFVCCSSLENSPNSLGEAMLLGVPCVSANVGGIPSLFEGDVDGILYEGFRLEDVGAKGDTHVMNGNDEAGHGVGAVTEGNGGPTVRSRRERGIDENDVRADLERIADRNDARADLERIADRNDAQAELERTVDRNDAQAELERISGNLADAIIKMWSNPEKRKEYCRNARAHALNTHDREKNYRRLVEIYGKIL